MTDFSVPIINAANRDGAPPEWVKLLAGGVLETRDGRGPFLVTDPEGIVAATNELAMTAGLPFDLDHSIDYAAPKGQPAPAAGWIRELQIRGGDIWGRVEWTQLGKEALSRGPNGEPPTYRYISPVFLFDEKTGEVQSLLRCALTNSPNLFDTAICANDERRKPMTTAEKIAYLRADAAANSSRYEECGATKMERQIIERFAGVSESSFVAAANRRKVREKDQAVEPLAPFTLKRVGEKYVRVPMVR